MSKARTGEKLSVLGPLGIGFMPPGTGQRAIFVAGGIGIAPLIFLAREIRERIEVFLAGYGTAEEIVGLDGLPDLGLALATDDGTCGHKGPVTDLLQARLESPARDQRMVFACGPLPMLKRVAAITLARNIPCQVSLEGSMACGLGACQGCAIRGLSGQKPAYLHVCHDGPVFDVKSIDWKVL